MRKFITHLLMFGVIGLLVGEIIARIFVLNSDIPHREIDKDGIQKYIPNQKGSWKGGGHKWQINDMGWPGPLPKAQENLITIIGDSFIESFMNPDECHQSAYLKTMKPTYNFMEASRSGVSFIEAVIISKQLDSLQPKYQLFYLHDSDFKESVIQIGRQNDITQLDIDKNIIIEGKLKSPGLKLILYNWKFLYFLYNQNAAKFTASPHEKKNGPISKEISESRLLEYKKLLIYVKQNYDMTNKIMIFSPDSNKDLIQLVKDLGFVAYRLNDDGDKSWFFDYDDHWNCYGHRKAAEQIAKKLSLDYISK